MFSPAHIFIRLLFAALVCWMHTDKMLFIVAHPFCQVRTKWALVHNSTFRMATDVRIKFGTTDSAVRAIETHFLVHAFTEQMSCKIVFLLVLYPPVPPGFKSAVGAEMQPAKVGHMVYQMVISREGSATVRDPFIRALFTDPAIAGSQADPAQEYQDKI